MRRQMVCLATSMAQQRNNTAIIKCCFSLLFAPLALPSTWSVYTPGLAAQPPCQALQHAAGNRCAVKASAMGVSAPNLASGLKLARHRLVHARCLKLVDVRGTSSGHHDLQGKSGSVLALHLQQHCYSHEQRCKATFCGHCLVPLISAV